MRDRTIRGITRLQINPVAFGKRDVTGNIFFPETYNIRCNVQIKLIVNNAPQVRVAGHFTAFGNAISAVTVILWGEPRRIGKETIPPARWQQLDEATRIEVGKLFAKAGIAPELATRSPRGASQTNAADKEPQD